MSNIRFICLFSLDVNKFIFGILNILENFLKIYYFIELLNFLENLFVILFLLGI